MPPLSYALDNEQHSSNFWTTTSTDYAFPEECVSSMEACDESMTSLPQAPQRKVSRRKNVSFFEMAEVYEVLHINDYTDLEKESCWFSAEDIRIIRKEARTAIALLEKGELVDDDSLGYTGRGLEHHTRENARQRMQTRCAVWDAVLDEQERQTREGECDPDQLFTLYHYFSVHSSILARRNALFDERDAQY